MTTATATAKVHRKAPLATPTDLAADAARDISGVLTAVLSDMFALDLKSKNFHWHVSGPHFRDYHLMLDEQGDQIFATTDAIAERVRKIGGATLRSIGQISRLQRIHDNDAEYVTPLDMLAELRQDNQQLTASMRETISATSVATSRPRACWKSGLTKRSGGPGSFTKRPAS
jgi:starvation-inducible DNA-binding protein